MMERKEGESYVTYYLFCDQVGSLRAVLDTSGDVVKEIAYDQFGNILGDTNPSFYVPLGFAGGLHDRDTGLVRFGYRDYDPDTARWTAKDPIGLAGDDVDFYAYCGNNPVNQADRLGLWGIQFGGFNMGVGDPWLLFDRRSMMESSKGACAVLDGIIPFWDPLEYSYADECGNVDSVLKLSQHLGGFARDIYLGARIPNLFEWLKGPRLYEKGSLTVPNRIWKMIDHMDVHERGQWLIDHPDILKQFGRIEKYKAFLKTWKTGLTPGGNLLVLGGVSAADAKIRGIG